MKTYREIGSQIRDKRARQSQRRPPLAELGILFLLTITAPGCNSSGKGIADGSAAGPRAAVVRVARGNLSSGLEIASEFEPYQEVDIYAKVSGYVQKLYIDWGTHVKQGQLLATLEIPELEQQLHGDEAAVQRSEQDIERAHQQLTQEQSSYDVAHVTYSRLADVQRSRPELISQQDIDVAKGKDLEGNAAVSGAKDAEAAAEASRAAAKATLAKDTALYSYARLTAPFNGVVTRMTAYAGALLPAGTSSNVGESALCHLSQNDILRLVIPVPERAVPGIRLGEAIDVTVSSLNKTFTGKVIRYSGQIDTNTRTMHTEVQVDNPKYEIVPGMYASVNLPLQTANDALTLPIQAVQTRGNGQGTVLLVNGANQIEQRDVKLGVQNADTFEILSSLKEGDTVIFGEQDQYKPGMTVIPQVVQPAAAE
jgi:RND family efflux transporter MFP subunit